MVEGAAPTSGNNCLIIVLHCKYLNLNLNESKLGSANPFLCNVLHKLGFVTKGFVFLTL